MRLAPAIVLGVALSAWGVEVRPAGALSVSSAAIDAAGRIDPRYSSYGANLSPPLRWTAATGAKVYVVTVRDPDAPSPRPFVHWLIWNLPASPQWLAPGAAAAPPSGAAQGRNDAGTIGYFGPRPPGGVHHYHLAVFALDARLNVAPGVGDAALEKAMRGHVLASGEIVGTFAAPR